MFHIVIIKTDIGKIIFERTSGRKPCALCSKMRKGALNNAMKELGCNKVAYAHHKDDVVTTMMLSLIYDGDFYLLSCYYLDRADMTVILSLNLHAGI